MRISARHVRHERLHKVFHSPINLCDLEVCAADPATILYHNARDHPSTGCRAGSVEAVKTVAAKSRESRGVKASHASVPQTQEKYNER